VGIAGLYKPEEGAVNGPEQAARSLILRLEQRRFASDVLIERLATRV